MSRTAKINVSQPEAKELWTACGTCGRETAHKVLTQVHQSDESPDGEIQVWNDYQTIICQGCKTVSFCKASRCSEDFDVGEGGQHELLVTRKLFPGRLAGRPLLQGVYDLPHGVARIYRETHDALGDKLPILTGIGLRAIVEAVCSDRKAVGNDLKARIQTLVTQAIITQEGADILHGIRLMGNKAAHETQANSDDELDAAFEVVEHLLKTVYIIPERAHKLKVGKTAGNRAHPTRWPRL